MVLPVHDHGIVLSGISTVARHLALLGFQPVKPAEFNAALGALEEYRGVDDVSVVGCVGSLIVATRGAVGPGEVLLSVRGSKEAYLAWSDQPLPRGTEVLVIDTRGARTVLVEPWIATDFTTQLP